MMKIGKALLFLTSSFSLYTVQADHSEITMDQIHGSGTTNPSKCIWHIMSLFNQRAKLPIRMTYRAVGSSTGQAEFLGKDNTDPHTTEDDNLKGLHWPHTDFGAGDIPVSTEMYNDLNASPTGQSAKKMVHLPFALSSVSFFYKLDGAEEVDLDGCLLSKIFARKITKWNDPEIVKVNSNLKDKDVEITVCRRTYGSSSTKSITKFLNIQCPNEWSDDMVSSSLEDKWHPDTKAIEGSAGMTECISSKNGAIGYMESGHGWSESLQEISLENRDGYFVRSKDAFQNGGIASAAEGADDLPTDATDDWGHVEFINKGGKNTFPIVLMSYVYVRTDISFFQPDIHMQGLLKLFLESLYMNEYIGVCKQLAFTPVPQDVKTTAKDGIDKKIKWEFLSVENPSGKNPWTFEIGTDKFIGTGDFVISSKRKSFQGVEIEDVLEMEEIVRLKIGETNEMGHTVMEYTSRESSRADAALALSALSFTLWCLVIVGWFVNRFFCGSAAHAAHKYNTPSVGDQI